MKLLLTVILAVGALAQQVDYPTQVKRGPSVDARGYQFTRTNGLGASGDLSASGAKTVTLTPCPRGVAGANTNHYVYISGGTGTAEAVLITGGTCTSGAASGTLTFTTSNTHTGAWSVTSATAGIQEAVTATASITPRTIYIPAGSAYASVYLESGDIKFVGSGWETSKIACSGPARLFTLKPDTVANQTAFSSRVLIWESFFIYGCGLAKIPDDTHNADITVRGMKVSNATSTAFLAGTDGTGMTGTGNAYMLRLTDNMFYANSGSPVVDIGTASDIRVENNFWLENTGVPIQLRGESFHVANNYFIANVSAETDIQIVPRASTNSFGWIENNKFGNELEVNTRNKIRFGTSASRTSLPESYSDQIQINNNYFGTADGQTVVMSYHRCYLCTFTNNTAINSITWWNDADNYGSGLGDSIFSGNRCFAQGKGGCTDFVNGGRGFSTIVPSAASGIAGVLPQWSAQDGPSQNLLTHSEALTDASWAKTGVSAAVNAVDPFGRSNSAATLTGSGVSVQSASSGAIVPSAGSYVFSVWMRAGTSSAAQVEVIDYNQSGKSLVRAPVQLTTAWKRYSFHAPSATTGANALTCVIRMADSTSGTILVFGAQLETGSMPSSYRKTSGSAVSSSPAHRIPVDLVVGRNVIFDSVPTSCSGLAAGSVYSDSGTLKVCP